MIPWTIVPYPDELWYSVCARWSARLGFSSVKAACRVLYGQPSQIPAVSVALHLDRIVANLPPGHNLDADRIIDGHTLLPLYSPFLPPDRVHSLRMLMRGDDASTMHMQLGLSKRTIPVPEDLRYCPVCVVEDRERYGEAYWHRLHQVPGLFLCPAHASALISSNISRMAIRRSRGFVTAEGALPAPLPRSATAPIPYVASHMRLAKDVEWLFQHRVSANEPPFFRSRYLALLIQHGLARPHGVLRRDAFLNVFTERFPAEFLAAVGCALHPQPAHTWPVRLTQKTTHSHHPLRHLLFMQLLGCSIERFFAMPQPVGPFGSGPWPCLNPACADYRRPVISAPEKMTWRRGGEAATGVFSCACGFAYRRVGSDPAGERRFTMLGIVRSGPLWDTMLETLWHDTSVNLAAVAGRLNLSIDSTNYHAARLRLPFPCPGSRSTVSAGVLEARGIRPRGRSQIDPVMRQRHRTAWSEAMTADASVGTTMLRKREPAAYNWLRKYDSAWFAEYSPQAQGQSPRRPGIDYAARDLELASLVADAAQELRDREPPKRISCHAISAILGRAELLSPPRLAQLPHTCAALTVAEESLADVAVRRVWFATKRFHREGLEPMRPQLERAAQCYRPSQRALIEVQTAIDLALASFNALGKIRQGNSISSS